MRSHGESDDAYHESIAAALPDLRENLTRFSLEDIFNADECDISYRMGPDKTAVHEMLPGREKAK